MNWDEIPINNNTIVAMAFALDELNKINNKEPRYTCKKNSCKCQICKHSKADGDKYHGMNCCCWCYAEPKPTINDVKGCQDGGINECDRFENIL